VDRNGTDSDEIARVHRANQRAWDLAAAKYAAELDADVACLARGETSLLAPELPALRRLAPSCRRAVHLQCSHGQDALSLWKLGAREVVGVDISGAMLAIARRKAERLGAPASWHQCDVLHAPHDLDGTADLVYTGKGALQWVMDLGAWGAVVARLLRPGGRLYLFEGHPLDWLWDPEAPDFRLRPGADYFSPSARANTTFPASAIERAIPPGASPPPALERQWTLGAVLDAVLGAGLILERLDEFPDQYWPQFPAIPPERAARLPHTFALTARKSTA
jgi:SAM-dependent methyltransferase